MVQIASQGLVLEDNRGNPALFSSTALSDLFRIFADQVECVLLNNCYGKVQAKAIVEHINYAIVMNCKVTDDVAIAFFKGFYDALGAGESLELAFEVGKKAVLGKASSRIPKAVS